EHALGLIARPDLLGEGFVARDDFAHLLLDRGKVLRRERLVAEEVVIEAVLDHGADGDLRAGPERLHRFREHMRAVVPDQLEAARILASEELDFRVALNRVVQVHERVVERHRDRAFGERGRDALGDVETGDAFGIVPTRAVGKGQGDHDQLLLLTRCLRTQVSVASKYLSVGWYATGANAGAAI